MRRLILLVLIVGGVVALLHYTDPWAAASAVASMPLRSLILLFALLTAGSLVRGARWSYYLRSAGVPIRRRDAMKSSIAGMSACALPGGSAFGARLAQEHGDVRMRDAMPPLFIRLVADLLVVATFALACTFNGSPSRSHMFAPILGLAMAATLIAMSRSTRVWRFVDRLLTCFRFTRRWLPQEADIHAQVRALVSPRVLVIGILYSMLTTALSILLLIVLVNGLTVRGINPVEATTVHTTAETVGTLAPIGLGFTVGDSSLAQMLNSLGIGWVRVMYLLLTLRSINLLFKTGVGGLALVAWYRGFLVGALDLPRRSKATRRWAGGALNHGRSGAGQL